MRSDVVRKFPGEVTSGHVDGGFTMSRETP